MKHISLFLFSLFCIGLLSNCQSHLKDPAPEVPRPEKWVNTQDLQINAQEEILWWEGFQDPTLTQLVQDAFKDNLSLKKAVAQVRQARAQLLGAEANLYPVIDAMGSVTHNRTSKTITSQPGIPSGTSYDLFTAGFDASWELDFFGKFQYAQQAALATVYSQIESLHAVRLSLAAEIAQNYLLLRSAQQQYATTIDSLKKWEDLYSLTQNLQKAGFTNAIVVNQTATSLEQTKASLWPLEGTIKSTIHQLSLLTGRTPTELYNLLLPPASIPQMPQSVFVGLPSDLLKRRPDIRAALRNLQAAAAEIGVAEADLFPQFSLTGSFGYESSKGSDLFNTKSIFSTFGPSFSWPIFDFGRVRANIETQKALQEEQFYQYKNSVLQAFQEVETSLVNLATEKQRTDSLEQALQAAKLAADLSDARFQLGQIDFLTVLQTYITQDTAALTLIQNKETEALNTIALYKALGGGWQTQEITPHEGQEG